MDHKGFINPLGNVQGSANWNKLLPNGKTAVLGAYPFAKMASWDKQPFQTAHLKAFDDFNGSWIRLSSYCSKIGAEPQSKHLQSTTCLEKKINKQYQ